ncbi:hypothetical protein BDQ17DRAFT_1421345 [Cyathus striatus]|nr:hypothetical protein BDQ17DRAFT_1421345 [Cyathus striatus]
MDAALPSSSLGTSRLGSIGPDRAHHTKPTGRLRDRDEEPYYRETSATSEEYSDYSPPLPLSRARGAHSRRKTENHIPRPRNAFIFFRSHFYQQRGLEGDKSTHQNDVSRNAGVIWRGLSAEQRRPFQELAEREKLEHQEKFPNYVYTPGGNKGSSRRRKSKSSSLAKKRKVSASTSRAAIRKATSEPKSEQVSPASTPFDDVCYSSHISAPHYSDGIIPTLALSSPSSDLPELEYPEPDVEDAARAYIPTFVPISDIPPLELSPSDHKQNQVTAESSTVHPLYQRMSPYMGYNPYIFSGGLDSSLPPLPQFEQDDVYNVEHILREPLTPEGLFSSQLAAPSNFELGLSPSYYEQKPVFSNPWLGGDILSFPTDLYSEFLNLDAYEST